MKRLTKQSLTGFTTIELLIALAIIGIVSAGFFSVFNTCMTSWNRFREAESLSLNGRVFLSEIMHTIRRGSWSVEIRTNELYLFYPGGSVRYSFIKEDETIYRVDNFPDGTTYMLALLKNVSDFRVSTDRNLLIISLKLKNKNKSINYRTAMSRREVL